MANDSAIYFDEWAFKAAQVRARFRTTAEVAEKAGLSPSYTTQITKGLIPPEATRRRIAEALGVEEADLWKPVGQAA